MSVDTRAQRDFGKNPRLQPAREARQGPGGLKPTLTAMVCASSISTESGLEPESASTPALPAPLADGTSPPASAHHSAVLKKVPPTHLARNDGE